MERFVMETKVKKDIIDMVVQKTDYPQEKVAVIVNGLIQVLREVLSEADPEIRIEIRGFGVLGIKKAKAKPKARNPRTNEIIYVPPHKKTYFKPGILLTNAIQK